MADNIDQISCEACKKEIPTSVALNMEGADYVYHFCSPDCRDHYFKQHPELNPDDFVDVQG